MFETQTAASQETFITPSALSNEDSKYCASLCEGELARTFQVSSIKNCLLSMTEEGRAVGEHILSLPRISSVIREASPLSPKGTLSTMIQAKAAPETEDLGVLLEEFQTRQSLLEDSLNFVKRELEESPLGNEQNFELPGAAPAENRKKRTSKKLTGLVINTRLPVPDQDEKSPTSASLLLLQSPYCASPSSAKASLQQCLISPFKMPKCSPFHHQDKLPIQNSPTDTSRAKGISPSLQYPPSPSLRSGHAPVTSNSDWMSVEEVKSVFNNALFSVRSCIEQHAGLEALGSSPLLGEQQDLVGQSHAKKRLSFAV